MWWTNQHIDQEITAALANHQPVTVSTTPNGGPLHESHAYIVEGITGADSDARLTLRNPWENNGLDDPSPLITVRLGDIIGSGLPGRFDNGRFGTHPTDGVNIGSLG